jgi:hypothetical protein
MQNSDENNGTLVIQAQELLTEKDCEQIIYCEGCAIGYASPPAERPSQSMAKHIKDFAGTVRLAALVYGNLSPDERRWMCEGVLDISEEIGREGYLTKFGIYRTEDHKRGCVIAFWPAQVSHNGEFRVPRKFDDLVKKNFVCRVASDPEAA